MRALRLSKCALLAGVALFFSLVVFNNITDYDANYQFVRHVLSMDSIFAGNHGAWRALRQPRVHTVFYATIIAWETLTGILCWTGLGALVRHLGASPAAFQRAKRTAIVALTMGALLWLIAFLDIGAEWFLMWQSHTWNGQEAAFRMFVVLVLTMMYLAAAEMEV